MARSNLTQRVLAAAVFGPLLMVLFWAGELPLLAGICVVVGVGTWEFNRMWTHKGLQPWTWFGIAASLVWCVGIHVAGIHSVPYLLAGLLLLVLMLALGRGQTGSRLAEAGITLMGSLYVGFLGSFALLVRNFSANGWSEKSAAGFALLVLVGIWADDIAAYFSGRWFGRWHPFPQISPGKTGAGFAGGWIAAVGVIAVGGRAFDLFPLWQGVGLGALVGVGAPLGDLVESMIKREAGVKDTSAIIPGHGGMLDRFDSFLFVFPLVYLYLTVSLK